MMAPQYPPTPQTGSFPPASPTTLTQTLPSYLYVQFADDENLQAFIASFNSIANSYASWFANVPLADYTNLNITDGLLDWTAAGIYGILRPTLSSGKFTSKGPYNTFALNTWPFKKLKVTGPQNIAATTDDIFKRIITWNFYKGDGDTFNVRWLKRRIMRFLNGVNGTAPNIDNTYPVSVSFGNNGFVSIRISSGTRKILGGALYNRVGFNARGIPLNSLRTQFVPGPTQPADAPILKEAIDSGVLQLPFQYTFSVSI